MSHVKTPITLSGYVQWVHTWRADQGEPVYLYGDDFATPYCPIEFEMCNDAL